MSDAATDTGADTGTDGGTQEQDAPTQERTQDRHDGNRPAGYEPVDPATATPEQVQQRIDYLYRQVKDQDRSLKDYRTIAQQQSAQINELVNGVGQVVNHLHGRQVAESEADIMQKMQTAWESGDNKAYLAEQNRLLDLKMQQRQQPQQRQGQPQPQVNPRSAAEIADAGNVSPEDYRTVRAWTDERDEKGQPLRPWASTADANDPDPDYVKMAVVAKKVWEQNPHKTTQENLAEVDRIMGTKQNGGGQTVLRGGLNTPGKRSTIRLTPQQEQIAVKTRYGANKGAKSDSEYIAAYRKQIETVQSKQRSR